MSADDRSIDEALRDRLRSEATAQRADPEAAAVLANLAPSLRRVRRRRTALVTTTAALGVVGAVGLAVIVRDATTPSIRTRTNLAPIDAVVPGQPSPERSLESSDPEGDDRPEHVATVDPLDEEAGADADHAIMTLPTTAPRISDGRIDPDAEGPQGDTAPGDDGSTSDGDDDVVVAGGAAPVPGLPSPSSTTVQPASAPIATTTLPPASSSTTSTTSPPPTEQWFTSECGDVLAVVTASSVEILDIRPDAGYRATVEDADHATVTVQFSGGGEDCELKIGPAETPHG